MESLFQIRFLHGYFSDGMLAEFQLTPDRATANLISRFQLVTRLQNGVFTMMGAGNNPDFIEYLRDQADAGEMRFVLSCDQEQFYFVTDLPLDQVAMLSLSTQSTQPYGADERELVPGLESGASTGESAIARVVVCLDDLLKLNAPPQYVVNFAARPVTWLYYVVNRSQVVFHQLEVVSRDGISLDGPIPSTVLGGEKALRYSSAPVNYPLQQSPSLIFDLVDRRTLPAGEDSLDHCYIKGLPTPTRRHVTRPENGNSQSMLCAMYVYV